MRLLLLPVLLSLHLPVGQPPAPVPPADTGFHFPKVLPTPMPPAPAPSPQPVTALSADQLFVTDTNDAAPLVLASPEGLVRITKDTGPLKIRGKFVDGKDIETRTYTGAAVYSIEAVATGRVELLFLSGSGKKIDRMTLDISVAPLPPAPVPPTPTPTPPVPTPAPISEAGMHVLVVYDDSKPLAPGQEDIVYGKDCRDWLDQNCVLEPDGKTKAYRLFKAGTDASKDRKVWSDAMKLAAGSNTCYLVVSNPGKGGYTGPLPATPTDFLALVGKYK